MLRSCSLFQKTEGCHTFLESPVLLSARHAVHVEYVILSSQLLFHFQLPTGRTEIGTANIQISPSHELENLLCVREEAGSI